MLNLRGVHVFKKTPNKEEWRLAEVHPAIRLTHGEEVIYLQDGTVYDGGGKPVPSDKMPGWFMDEVSKMTPEALRSVGLKLKEAKE